jgi:hypothetical protein
MAGKGFEYGLLVAPLGQGDTDTTISKAGFFERLEAQYPSAEGWEVWNTDSFSTGTGVVVVYHTKRALK